MREQVDRDERWQREREERAENKRKWMERKERKREMKLARAKGRELPHRDQPARLVNGPREPNIRSRTGEDGDGSHDHGAMLYSSCPSEATGLPTRSVALPY